MSSSPSGAETEPKVAEESKKGHRHHLPIYNSSRNKQSTPGIAPDGESGRSGVHPIQFLRICFRSSCTVSKWVNVLWPVVPAAIAVHYARRDAHVAIFVLAYIAMVPSANLIGFAGQELARKGPKVVGVIAETALGSVVEIILFMVLISKGDSQVPVIKAAILGSILANLLLCMGACFFAGGLRRSEQEFHPAVSEVGTGLMLVASMALIIPSVYAATVTGETASGENDALKISRACAIILLIAFLAYVWFQLRSHHGIYDAVLEADEEKDADRHRDQYKEKLTLTEGILALVIALTMVSLMAVFLVEQIEFIVEERGVSDAFMGLILVPLVEKAAEHLTAVDEAWDNQMNFALSHVMGASIQTALFNTPLVVIVGWGLQRQMDLKFEIFDSVVLILAVLVAGNFLRDGKSNYLEGLLLILVYVVIAVCAFINPTLPHGAEGGGSHESGGAESGGSHEGGGAEGGAGAGEHAARLLRML